MSPPESWSLSPPIRRLLLSVLALLPFLFGGSVHAQSATDPSVIDVAVFYTPAAKTANGWTSKQQAEAAIEALVTETNLAYTNSDVNQTIKLVAVEEVEGYIQATDTANKTGKNIDLDRLKEPSDGYMDDVHTVRDRVGADIVMLLRSEGGGQAFMMTVLSADSAVGAFGVSTVHAGLFAHEMGHIMGLAHDRYADCKHDTDSPQCPTTVKPYAYGYVNQKMFDSEGSTTADPDAPATARWRTVMAYFNQCRDAGLSPCGAALLRFSNPNQRYPDPTTGDPMGKSGTQNTTAVDGPADAARTLNETRTTVANFRPGRAVQVAFDVGPYMVNEGGSVTVTVRLDAAPGRTLDMPIPLTATSTDGAWPGDYTLPASITFGAGQTLKTFTFRAVQDTRQEDQETVILGFGAPLPAGVTVGSQATATVTLLTDNDADLHRASVPSVSTVAIISDPGVAYAAGEEIKVAVVFTKPIMVTGTPSIELMVGANTRQALCQTVASEVLTCTYTVVADESDTDGVSIAANKLTLNGGTIQDKESTPQNATRTHTAVAADSDHTVDGDTPDLETAVVDADTVTLTYDKALDETSIPRANAFTVTAGGATALITFVQVSGSVVTLTLVSNIAHDLVVTLAYSPLSGTPRLQDLAGNAAADLSSRTLTNNTPMPIYDTDDDGLIEISTLAQLDAMRHDLNGDGRPTTDGAPAYAAAFRNVTRVVCGARSNGECEGYELMADLDFFDTNGTNGDGQVDTNDDTNGDGRVDAEDNTTYWNGGAGWMPIGAGSNWFETTFEGNSYTISNLFVDRSSTNKVGLFGLAGVSSVIRRVGLLDIRVTGARYVGGLVGLSDSDITGSYATGQVAGAAWVGGLIGGNGIGGKIHASYTTGRVRVMGGFHAGGLVGLNNGGIYTSYATGRVSGTSGIGGLVGRMGENGDITASYATGHVSGNNHAGGLLGSLAGGTIRVSYATGRVSSGGSHVGGLVGENLADTTFTASYWDTRTSGQTSSAGGTAKTTRELQTPTDYTTGSIYADWNVDPDGDSMGNDPWDFGTSSQYPVLKADFDGQGAATWREFGSQLRVGPTLTVTTDTGLIELSWPAVTPHWTPPPDVTYTVYRNTGSTVEAIAEDPPDREYTDRAVTRDIAYTYQVAAVVDGGEATRSELVTVTAPNQPPAFDDRPSTTRTIAENTTGNIGNPVKATDPDDSTLYYSLDAASAAVFTITESTGQLRTSNALNYEARSTYNVTVSVRDGKDVNNADDMDEDATIAVTIEVTDVNEAPTFSVTGPVSLNVDEDTLTGRVLDDFSATDPDTLTLAYSGLTYSLRGSEVFFLEPGTGELILRKALDYESQPHSYQVEVSVSDGKNAAGAEDSTADATLRVTINIVNVDEAGLVALTPDSPQEKQTLMAELSDLDGHLSEISWQWFRSATRTDLGTEITEAASSGAAMARYTPGTDDVGQYLRATASYTDGHGTGKEESATTTAQVQEAPQVSLKLSPSSITEQEGVSTVTAELTRASGAETRVRVEVTAGAGAVTPSRNRALTIPANQTTSTGDPVTLTAKDNKVDGPETTEVTVTGTLTHNLLVTAPDPVTLTITDEDARGVTVSTDTLSIREEDTGEYKVKLNSEPTANVTVTVTGHVGTDVTLTPSSATLTFTPTTWNRLQKVTVSTEHDADAVNDNVTLTHTARGGDYDGATATVAVTVTDNEKKSTTVNLSVNLDTVTEGASRTVTVTGELDGAPRTEMEGDAVVSVMVKSGTATLDTDFTVADISKLTISEGRTSGTATFTLTTKDDNIYDPDETITVRGSTTATLDVTTATLTITDNDGPPTVQRLEVADASIPILEDGGETTVTVTLSHPSSSETVVGLTVPVGAAAVRLSQRELTIPAEATSGEVTLTAVGNAVDGAHQPVTVSGRVSNLSGSRSPAQVQLTITDDDPPEVSGDTQKDYTEGDTGPVAEYTATNPADVQLEWLRAGPDAALFRIDRIDRTRGALHFRNSPDYEARADKNYQVTVQAADTTSIPGETLTGERTVTVTVRDAPGEVILKPSSPRVGRVLTATVEDGVDGVDEVTQWCWARSPFRDFLLDTTETCISTNLTTTATYTPDNEDVNQYIRATATYTDSDETANKEAMRASAGVVSDRQTDSFRPPGNTGGGGGGGGGGAPACADDLHGNTATQSTDSALSAVTAGAICPAADVDYFTVTAPGQGLVFVDTTGGVQTLGSIWQNDVALASGSTGRPPDERLGARVQAGLVVVAVQGQGGATGPYAVEITFVQGYLENPGPDSFQSGVGLLSGWVCDADMVEIELNGMPQEAAYGTERLDTASVCGDTDNGFGLLFNWNLLGDGDHEVVALVDGVELDRATVTVTTLGAEFLRDVTGTCTAADFPTMDETVTLVWQQTQQSFVIVDGPAPAGTTNRMGTPGVGYLENPGPNSFQSGIGVLSGWVCDADTVELAIGTAGRQVAAYGTERLDTQGACGDTANGFGLLFNWNLLGEGEHEVVAFVDGEELGRATVRVTTLGAEFVRGAEGECVVEDFPMPGETVLLEWQQNKQNFVITDVE